MMVLLPASVLVTVGVATRVTWTAAVVEDIGKTPMSKMEYNCFTSSGDSGGRFWHISYTYSITKLHTSCVVYYILNYKSIWMVHVP